MLTEQHKTELRKLNSAERKLATRQQINRIHSAVDHGTIDRETISDALERLVELTQQDEPGQKGVPPVSNEKDSFADFTGQKPEDDEKKPNDKPVPPAAKVVDGKRPHA